MTNGERRGPPWGLILLMIVFIGPAAIAWTLFFSGWRPGETANHGELITPPHHLQGNLHTADGPAISADGLRGKWSIVVLNRGACERDCVDRLEQTRQVRRALAQYMDRARRLLVLPADAPDLAEDVLAEHLDLTVYRTADNLIPPGQPYADAPLHVSLLDTRGYRMLAYPEPLDAGGLLSDMKRLMRLSNVELERLQGLSDGG